MKSQTHIFAVVTIAFAVLTQGTSATTRRHRSRLLRESATPVVIKGSTKQETRKLQPNGPKDPKGKDGKGKGKDGKGKSGWSNMMEPDTLTAAMGIYPGPNRSAAPGGFVEMTFQGNGDIDILMDTFDMAPDCYQDITGVNTCGVHIHAGTHCDMDSRVGEHYYDPSSFSMDPWQNVRYKSDDQGRTDIMSFTMSGGNGYDMSNNEDHAVVIHDKNGNKMSCGILYSYSDS
jgi:hypothetical protein